MYRANYALDAASLSWSMVQFDNPKIIQVTL